MSSCAALDLYEPLDVIGNGSFGIIRKVRRIADGAILARKELNFERMTERDRKQIVAEVNILKDLHHENIVRYHDRFVDRDAGILYILMEYCGGGDLSAVIKQCARCNRPLPEDTIWSYFYQLLLALTYCHFPNAKAGDSNSDVDAGNGSKRQQILHRDLKPENVFLDGNNTVKLGDFGLSKALGQASFANTYVGTPYYMSPELMQEKSYDTKSDIWSLGCLIYELCAQKPPFHEAKTHSELSVMIRNGRIPPLPKGYSQALSQVIKAMLNLNPAMRPSAHQLLQHERIDFARKVIETEKMLATVKAHKQSIQSREREVQAAEAALAEREAYFIAALAERDREIERLGMQVTQAEQQKHDAVAKTEQDLRLTHLKREEEVLNAMAKREEEVMAAVRKREAEINELWRTHETELRKEFDSAIDWVQSREQQLAAEVERLERARAELEREAGEIATSKGRRDKTPLEEVKNLLAPLTRLAREEAYGYTPKRSNLPVRPTLETPMGRPLTGTGLDTPCLIPGSAMRGVILTTTGEPVATPRSTELEKLMMESPRVGLNFKKIFDFESETETETDDEDGEDQRRHSVEEPEFSSPSRREDMSGSHTRSKSASGGRIPPTRLRKPSIRKSSGNQRPPIPQSMSWPSLSSIALPGDSTTSSSVESVGAGHTVPPTPRYDPSDEENLPSPFLKRADKDKATSVNPRAAIGSTVVSKAKGSRRSNGNLLRVMAATNSANNLSNMSPSPSITKSSA
ncbi:kinase-like protein [Rickenella mellea]|uniref:non-specific serine/threonine protein kinase n=1 Tax=Rickenella mellea TaxID=50990 RepID=A0A4Y7QEQ5_9AGAM|nr:kinase-like protein [Rickenella mellea]